MPAILSSIFTACPKGRASRSPSSARTRSRTSSAPMKPCGRTGALPEVRRPPDRLLSPRRAGALFPSRPYQLRNVRAVLSVVLPCESLDDMARLQQILALREGLISTAAECLPLQPRLGRGRSHQLVRAHPEPAGDDPRRTAPPRLRPGVRDPQPDDLGDTIQRVTPGGLLYRAAGVSQRDLPQGVLGASLPGELLARRDVGAPRRLLPVDARLPVPVPDRPRRAGPRLRGNPPHGDAPAAPGRRSRADSQMRASSPTSSRRSATGTSPSARSTPAGASSTSTTRCSSSAQRTSTCAASMPPGRSGARGIRAHARHLHAGPGPARPPCRCRSRPRSSTTSRRRSASPPRRSPTR